MSSEVDPMQITVAVFDRFVYKFKEVLEVRDGAFRSSLKAGAEKAFVYGREVDDLRSVDYDAIAMLNVSATQELAKKLEVKDAVIAALEARLSALEKRVSGAK